MPQKQDTVSQGRKCGFTKKDGKPCQNPAGLGTVHPGWGICKKHGGDMPSFAKSAMRKEVQARVAGRTWVGEPKQITAAEGLMEEVRRSAGVVAWIEGVIGEFETEDVTQLTEVGWRAAEWTKAFREERKHFAMVCKLAVDAGVAEAIVKLEQQRGMLLAAALRELLDGLNLTQEQWVLAPGLARAALMKAAETAA